MKVALNRLHYPVTSLGVGTRAGIWLQGCSIGCRGCISRDTWMPDGGRQIEVAEILEWVQGLPGEPAGATISGGEPFDQPEPLRELLDGLNSWRRAAGGEVDVLCYSGYPLRRLERRHPDLLALLDAAITGPFREDKPTDLLWRGSSNQELVPLSDLGRARYGALVDARTRSPRMQVAVEAEAVRMIGIPRRGDMAALEAKLAAAGVELGEASWTS